MNRFSVGAMLLLACAGLSAFLPLAAAAAPSAWKTPNPQRRVTLDNTFFYQLTSQHTGRSHELIVFVPESFEREPKRTYPVVYFTDGYWDMTAMAAAYQNLRWDNELPELVMVGFSYAGEKADYGALRDCDLSPTPVKNKPCTGAADAFLTFIEREAMPFIEKNYRGNKRERALIGTSMGGLFAAYALYQKTDLFGRFGIISPASGWDQGAILELDNAYHKAHKDLPARVYFAVGEREYEPFRRWGEKHQALLASRDYPNLALHSHVIQDARHVGVKPEAFTRALRVLFADIAPSGPSGLQKAMESH